MVEGDGVGWVWGWWGGGWPTGYGDVAFGVDADGEVVEVESYGEGTDYLALFGGEGGGELECHALIFGIVAEELHCSVKAQRFRIIHIEVFINTYIPARGGYLSAVSSLDLVVRFVVVVMDREYHSPWASTPVVPPLL